MMASLGAYKGVAQLGRIRITGLPAWVLWRALYIGMLPHFSTRLRVALNWLFDYFMPRTIVQMAQEEKSNFKSSHYRKGEIVYERKEIMQGFYIVLNGKFKLVIEEKNGGKIEKVLKKGDHGGDKAIQASHLTLGKLVALEDGELLFIDSSDFMQLCEVIPVIRAHLKNKSDKNIVALFDESS